MGDDGMGPMAMAPPRSGHATAAAPPPPQHKMAMMMHMTFFWSDRAVVLIRGWPGERGAGMYALCLLFVLALAALTEGSPCSRAASPAAARRLLGWRPPGAGAGVVRGAADRGARGQDGDGVPGDAGRHVVQRQGCSSPLSPATPSGSSSRGAGCGRPPVTAAAAWPVSTVASLPRMDPRLSPHRFR